MLAGHNKPDGKPCNMPAHTGTNCLHCGTMVSSAPQYPLPPEEEEPEVDEEVQAAMKAAEKAKRKNREMVRGLVVEHMSVEHMVEIMVDDFGCQTGSVTIGQTREIVILPKAK